MEYYDVGLIESEKTWTKNQETQNHVPFLILANFDLEQNNSAFYP